MAKKLEPAHTGYEQQVRESFGRQTLMTTLGATISSVTPGKVEIELPTAPHISQQNGFVHAGAVSAIGDTACGYAAFSLAGADQDVLTVEFKINLLNPARGDKLIARGEVLRRGRSITICEGRIFAVEGGEETLVAIMLASMILRSKSP